jgi:ABC-2 type transport system ATP-binding protein
MSEAILQVNSVTKIFPVPFCLSNIWVSSHRRLSPVVVLKDVSFSVKKGEIAALLGPNGAGKTTLLKIISTLILPDKGSIIFDSKLQAGRDDDAIKKNIGFSSSSEKGFYPRLTGEENIAFFAALFNLPARQIRQKMYELFDIFGIAFAKKRFDTYSAGMQQKISLVRSLIHQPSVILLDEPTRSLDYDTAQKVRRYLSVLAEKEGKTIIITTHQLKEAEDLANTFLFLNKGSVAACGSRHDLEQKYGLQAASIAQIYQNLIRT